MNITIIVYNSVAYDTIIMSVACARFGLYKAHGVLPVFVAPEQLEFRPKVNFEF